MNKNKWFLNGGRGSGRTFRLLCETYENKIADLEDKLANADYQLEGRYNEIAELKQESKVLAQNLEDTEIVNKALEKENAELRAKESFVGDQNRKLCDQQQKIEVLEAENAELKEKLKTAYRKGMRHMAKALKDYDRTDGAWTDYFEHTVDKVLQREQLDFEEYGTLADQLTKAKELLERLLITSCNSDVLNLLPNCSEVLRVRVEAEQFLNREVEK